MEFGLDEKKRYIINPGSISCGRSAYESLAIVDLDKSLVKFKRV